VTFNKVGIVGTGQMGLGIAQVLAQNGVDTTVVKYTGGDVDPKRATIDKNLGKLVDKGKLSAEDKQSTLDALTFSVHLRDLHDCDLIIESIVEEVDTKSELFRQLDEVVGETAVFTSNTSTLSITELAANVDRRDRFFGLHFFNPATMMALVEVIGTIETDEAVEQQLVAFCEEIGKKPVPVKDETGFIVNRLLTPYMVDAIRSYERGLAGIGEIDKAMKLGTNHPMGPLELADYIGLDIVYHMSENLWQTYREPRLAPPPLLVRLVQAGQLGRKVKLGFYDYSSRPPQPRAL